MEGPLHSSTLCLILERGLDVHAAQTRRTCEREKTSSPVVPPMIKLVKLEWGRGRSRTNVIFKVARTVRAQRIYVSFSVWTKNCQTSFDSLPRSGLFFQDRRNSSPKCRDRNGGFLHTLFFCCSHLPLFPYPDPAAAAAAAAARGSERERRRRSVIDVEGGPQSVVWAVQLSDLHFSVFHPERAQDFKRLVGPALSMIKPSLVLITGDLADGKSKDLLTMKQEEAEWIEYRNTMEEIIQQSGLDEKIFYDLRGNHDCFGVPEVGGAYDFYQKYSLNSRLRRQGDVQSITLQNGGWKHVFIGLDSTMEIGLRGPTNLFGHPTDKLLADLDAELSQWDAEAPKSSITKISFGHFPLSFSASSDTGKSLRDVFLKHSISTYLCGHLHTRFGKNLKRFHTLPSGKYYQFNIQQGTAHDIGKQNCSLKAEPAKEFWEWEMGDWRKNRAMRIVAIDSGHVSFLDTDFKFGSRDMIILPTFPLDSRFMQRVSYLRDYKCQTMRTSSYDTIRALIFTTKRVVSVSAKIYDSLPGTLSLVLDSSMVKLDDNGTRGDLYVAPWNWRAFVDSSPDRYWLQIEAIDISGSINYSQLRPLSINGLPYKINWRWREFYVMGIQWAAMYHPILWTVIALIFSLLIMPQAFLMCSKQPYTYKRVNPSFTGRSQRECMLPGAFWVLMELSRAPIIWTGIFLYVLYLMFFPWIYGHIFTESNKMAYMNYKGWNVSGYIGVPDVMVVVIPHLCFVVLPTILVAAVLTSERTAYRTHFFSLSGKKEDDQFVEGKRHVKHRIFCDAFCFSSWRWLRKFFLLICLAILWKHLKQCRALVKAYDMNPVLHAPVYCFWIPVLLAYTTYITAAV
ncbi:putative metallophosphoesterase At3g03305 [Asparagus officinalis]|uniref:putative metallophosphoesterase At3g03305 n=1 Tax=Asparagus officinalis TaxID=4686 RepID=UPI00098E396A|nr:putative metallophosphoesterase At3g03305 [Asparagus officinalis]